MSPISKFPTSQDSPASGLINPDAIPRFVLLLCLLILTTIPLKVIGYGYQPGDDALRHAGKVISGKDWQDILVIRPDITMDSHPGWHFVLGQLYKGIGSPANAGDVLVCFSVIATFLLLTLPPLFYTRRPEAWLLALLAIIPFIPTFHGRLLLGRPFAISMAGVVYLCFTWRKLRLRKNPWPVLAGLTAAVTASTWIHCSWFLWALPILAFFIAREWRAAYRLILCVGVGVIAGAILTGHPVVFLTQTLLHGLQSASADVLARRQLVTELRPMKVDPALVLMVGSLLAWRSLRGGWRRGAVDNPVFILAVLCWMLGFQVSRFWLDWGAPALLVWVAIEIRGGLRRHVKVFALQRVGITLVGGLVFFLALTNDYESRWTGALTREYIDASKPELKDWMPEPGGIFYSSDMDFFTKHFLKTHMENGNTHWVLNHPCCPRTTGIPS